MLIKNANDGKLRDYSRRLTSPIPINQTFLNLENLIGRKGITQTVFRLQGYVKIDHEIYEAEARGRCLPKGEVVKIVAVAFGRPVVERVEDSKLVSEIRNMDFLTSKFSLNEKTK